MAREEELQVLSEWLDLSILDIRVEGSVWTLVMQNGSKVKLIADDLVSQKRFRTRVITCSHEMPEEIRKREEWDDVVRCILKLAKKGEPAP